jgi:hypothetical protein
MTKIKFKQFLADATLPKNVMKKWASRKIDIDRAIKLLNTHCKDGLKAISNGGVIQRGFSEKLPHNLQIMDSSKGHRLSRDTINLYQMMMNSSEALSDYPSRSNSFICLSSRSEYYGSRYVMIPFDNTKVAVIEKDDIFDVYVKNISGLARSNPSTLSGVSGSVMSLLRFFKIGPEIATKNGYKFDGQTAAIDKKLANISPKTLTIAYEFLVDSTSIDSEVHRIMVKEMKHFEPYDSDSNATAIAKLLTHYNSNDFNKSKTFFNLMNDNPDKKFTAWCSALFTPDSLGLSLMQYGDFIPPRLECWFSGKAIVMSLKLWAGILVELQKQGHPIHHTVTKDALPEIKHIWDTLNDNKDIKYESVNDEVFKYGFRQKKNILGDKYTLIASSGWTKNSGDDSEEFKITAKDEQGVEIGWVTFKESNDKLEAFDLSILPMHRRKGIASEMYKFARELGNDIAQSTLQTELGKKFWSQKDHSK